MRKYAAFFWTALMVLVISQDKQKNDLCNVPGLSDWEFFYSYPTSPSTPTTSKETPKETPTTPKTGDDRNPLIWLMLLGIGGCVAGAAWYLRKKDEKDQNQD